MPLTSLLRHAAFGAWTTGLFCGLVATASAQGFRVETLSLRGPILAEATAASPETVRLLTGLAKIESDLQLGLLFLAEGLVNPEGSHFSHPLLETYPAIKDGLAAAGIADFAPLLAALEQGGDKDTVMASYTAAVGAVMKARSSLQASDSDLLASILDQVRAIAAELNPTGPTEAQNYQDAWAMLVVARNEIDLLTRSADPVIAKSAGEMALALDDMILSMPDPATSAPVTFDPAPVLTVIRALEGLVGSA